ALKTILEIAHEEGRATGIVTDGALTNPTAAAFYAHASNTKQPQEFASALIDRGAVDIAFGGGAAEFNKEKLNQARIRIVHNLGERALHETAELDRAVQVGREYAGRNAAIIVCGDAAIGGLSINGYPFRYDSGVAILGLNSAGQPWVSWATGPNGGKNGGNTESPGARDLSALEPAAIQSPSAVNSIEDPIANATGVRMEKLHGTIDSTDVFTIIRDAL